MGIHDKFNELTEDEKEFISDSLDAMFKNRHRYGVQFLDGDDGCERVAEAMAVWLLTSKPKAGEPVTFSQYVQAQHQPSVKCQDCDDPAVAGNIRCERCLQHYAELKLSGHEL